MEIISVTPQNIEQETLFCVKDVKSEAFLVKRKWFEQRYHEGLRIRILKDEKEKPLAFIEFIPVESAWRPVDAQNYMFVQCMYVYANKDKNVGNGSLLLKASEEEAVNQNMAGMVSMTSKGSWMTDKRLFEKNGYTEVDKLGRFELMVKKFDESAPDPKLFNWKEKQKNYIGWHLLYADQCPWHQKSVDAIVETAKEAGIDLQVKKIMSSEDVKNGPSGFGTFALLHDGKLLEEHYISQTRFKNILNKELKTK